MDEVKKLCTSLRRNAKEERVLFHYNGHGVPRPTVNGEIWVFNKVGALSEVRVNPVRFSCCPKLCKCWWSAAVPFAHGSVAGHSASTDPDAVRLDQRRGPAVWQGVVGSSLSQP